MPLSLIEYISCTQELVKVQGFLKQFCDLDLELIDLNGRIYPIARPPLSVLPADLFLSDGAYSAPEKMAPGFQLPEDLQNEYSCSREPRHLPSSDGIVRTLFPIVNGGTLGYLMVIRRQQTPLNKARMSLALSYITMFLNSVIRDMSVIMHDFTGCPVNYKRSLLHSVVSYIREHCHDHAISLRDVAAAHHVSYFYLSHLFKKELKVSFKSFLNHIRVEIAEHLLMDHRLTVQEVSFACGFDDAGYFTKVFKRFTGTPPVVFRFRENRASTASSQVVSSTHIRKIRQSALAAL